MSLRRVGHFALALLLLAGCGREDAFVAGAEPSELGIVEGSREARAIVALVNAEETTEARLDIDVGLDRRAARNLIARRSGDDGRLGTSDDRPYQSLTEIDAVPYVGSSALDRLLSYATERGYLEPETITGGTFEGVYFTEEQASSALALVNRASLEFLDEELRLDRRAASNLVFERPFSSLSEISEVAYVGAVALRLIRDYVDRSQARAAVCSREQACSGVLVCVGRPALGQSIGRCVDPDATDWRSAEFVDEGQGSIPELQAGGTGAGLLAYGLAPVVTRAELSIEVSHARPSDLRFELEDPNGGVIAIARDPDARGPIYRASHEIVPPATAAANGMWLLRFFDDVRGEEGVYLGWRLRLQTRWPTTAETVQRLQPVLGLSSLYHLSESDYRYQLVNLPGQGDALFDPTQLRAALAAVHQPAGGGPGFDELELETAEVEAFFDRYTEAQSWWDEDWFQFVEPYLRLRTLLREELLDVAVFRFGARSSSSAPLSGAVDVFILGRTRTGDLVGVWTVSVET